jgi:hypothetical protein
MRTPRLVTNGMPGPTLLNLSPLYPVAHQMSPEAPKRSSWSKACRTTVGLGSLFGSGRSFPDAPSVGQISFRFTEIMSSPRIKNILLFISANQNYKPCHLIPEEGRRPSPPNVGMGCGGRGRRQACFFAPDETPTAYGEVVWSWRRDAGVKLAGSFPPMTVANSPFTGESAK